jgi:pimeloyl-ACP methyl ester carboxylesterase
VPASSGHSSVEGIVDPKSFDHRGCPLSYQVRGDGPPVLFIQGVGVHGDGWLPQVEALSSTHRCLWFDNRGLGRSQPAGTAVTVEQMAEDARILMDAEGWQSAHIVGHSLGGLAALHLALSARPRVRSLSLLCTFARGRDVGRLTPWLVWMGLRTLVGTRRMRRNAFLQMILPPGVLAVENKEVIAERLTPLFGHDLVTLPPVARLQLKAMKAYDATPRLAELAGLPTLVVSGKHDRIASPVLGRAIASGIPGAEYIELDDAAHAAPIHCSDAVNALILDHLRKSEIP